MAAKSSVRSPCISRCWDIDTKTEVCRGCFRSLDEVWRWPKMTDAQRKAVLKRCKQRSKKRRGG